MCACGSGLPEVSESVSGLEFGAVWSLGLGPREHSIRFLTV